MKRGASCSDLLEKQRQRESFEVRHTPDFAKTGAFTGEDEKFAYKRAASRLWEMCGAKWWARREEGWCKPVPVEARRWERSVDEEGRQLDATDGTIVGGKEQLSAGAVEGMGAARDITEKEDEVMFKHGASPFRTVNEPPSKFGFQHIWGTVKWGKKAGAWGQGVEGLKERNKDDDRDGNK